MLLTFLLTKVYEGLRFLLVGTTASFLLILFRDLEGGAILAVWGTIIGFTILKRLILVLIL